MCKIIALTNGSKLKQGDINKIGAILAESQKDGLGYAAIGSKGVFGERTLNPTRFKQALSLKPNKLQWVTRTQEVFGTPSKISGAFMMHGRTSTNTVNLINTHPIEIKGNFLIHNGVVTNKGEAYDKNTTNDSEDILHHFLNGGIDVVAANLTGYYACVIIDKNGFTHVFKDKIAQLYSGYSTVLDSYLFGTTREILEKTVKKLKLDKIIFEPMTSDTYLKFKGNKLVEAREFKSLGYGYEESKHSRRSLGYKLDLKYPKIDGDVSDSFWEELDYADASYTYFDAAGFKLDYEAFNCLSSSEKLDCTVKRGDGSIVKHRNDSYWELKCSNVDNRYQYE